MGRSEQLIVAFDGATRISELRHEYTGGASFSLIKQPLLPLLSFGTWHLWVSEVARDLASAGVGPGLPGGSPDRLVAVGDASYGRYLVTRDWLSDFDLGWLHGGGTAALVCGEVEMDVASLRSLLDQHALPVGAPAAIVLDGDFDFAWVLWSPEFDAQAAELQGWANRP